MANIDNEEYSALKEICKYIDEIGETKVSATNLDDDFNDYDELEQIVRYLDKMNLEVEAKKKAESNKLRKSVFDSKEEKIFFDDLNTSINLEKFYIEIHVPLNNIFLNPNEKFETNLYKFKLKNQHCDFLIRRKEDFSIIAAIEIDGIQHKILEKQRLNDIYKDRTFKANDILLIRFTTKQVRDHTWKDTLKIEYPTIYKEIM